MTYGRSVWAAQSRRLRHPVPPDTRNIGAEKNRWKEERIRHKAGIRLMNARRHLLRHGHSPETEDACGILHTASQRVKRKGK